MENRFESFKMIEPLKKNRFIISFKGVDIPQYLFRKYEIYNEGEELFFETSIWETVNYVFNPNDLFNIVGVKIEYLDPIGETVNGIDFDIKGSNFNTNMSYEKDEISEINFKFTIYKNTIKLIYKNK